MQEISHINEKCHEQCEQVHEKMVKNIDKQLHDGDVVKKVAEAIVEIVETEKQKKQKESIEGSVRDHLRGFSRTIPAFSWRMVMKRRRWPTLIL